MTSLGVDVSNYSNPLTPVTLQAWKDAGVQLVIVQAIDPPAGYPPGQTRDQIQACLDAGLVVDAYVYLWFDLDVSDIHVKLGLLDGLPIRRLWLDVEDEAAKHYDQVVCEQKVSDALAVCDAYPTTGGERTGIYTGAWFWQPSAYMNDTTVFSDRDLWSADYDGVADTTVGTLYGGWSRVAIKQFLGTTTFHGVSGVDLNALSDEETAKLTPSDPNPCAGLINGVAYIADTLGDQLLAECKRASVRKAEVKRIVAEMERVRVEEVGPRP